MPPAEELLTLDEAGPRQRRDAARVLLEALAHVPSAWKSLAEATDEVASFIGSDERVAFVAVEAGAVRGWIGAIRHSAHAWELHPLVVDPACQRQGWGTKLVAALEVAARRAGIVTIWLGSDDDYGGTNLYGRDLYPAVLDHLRTIRATAGHPFTFYQRVGYHVTGVLPDADGLGKHDILMAKRIARTPD